MPTQPRLTYVRTVYGDRYRVSLDALENPSGLSVNTIWRYNAQGRIVTDKRTHSHQCVLRGNIVGPWPGCVHDLAEHNRRMDRIAAGLPA